MINRPRLKAIRISTLELKDYLHRKLNFPCRCSSGRQPTRHRIWGSRPIKNIRVCRRGGRSKVWMIENVEDLGAELNVESLGNSLNVIILEKREVQRCDAWANQDVAPCIAAKVEAWIRW